MNKRKYFIWLVLAIVFGFVLFVWCVPTFLLSSMEQDNATVVSDSWVITIYATGNVDVLAYSADEFAEAGASLYDESGNLILETTPQLTPGNYAGKGSLKAGNYILVGERTTLDFSGNGFVGYENPSSDEANVKLAIFAWIFYSVLVSIFTLRSMREDEARLAS